MNFSAQVVQDLGTTTLHTSCTVNTLLHSVGFIPDVLHVRNPSLLCPSGDRSSLPSYCPTETTALPMSAFVGDFEPKEGIKYSLIIFNSYVLRLRT